jgi:DNA-binding XRE family transcriptional regulator
MPGPKRSDAVIEGERLAALARDAAGVRIRSARRLRRLSQAALASKVDISRPTLAAIEAGHGHVDLETWFALAKTLDLYLRFEFGRDPMAELRDAGHVAMQELALRVGKSGGWERLVESLSRVYGSDRSIDVRMAHRRARQIAIVECWNTFGDLGDSLRSSTRKLRDAQEQAVAIAADGPPYQVGLLWIVRDTRANRELIGRYPEVFASAFPGSSQQWLRALESGTPVPATPGLVWCDTKATRLYARRRGRGAR